ncbi:circularly permutated Ras protein 1 isoform X2 [Pristis pectinata]|uniref:circularly permutated Ras protein 1 isoform X2 n=1 Tax=Pristis pectinata TaxID=685728 RepID=UPI00223E3325|nr:circularly permutated Ras protein 1 isoform X2 [Pristis pectinata]
MEFACSHIVYNSQSITSKNGRNRAYGPVENQTYSSTSFRPPPAQSQGSVHEYDNRFLVSSPAGKECLYATVPKPAHRRNQAKSLGPPVVARTTQLRDNEDSQAPPLPPRLSIERPNVFTTHQLSTTLPAKLHSHPQLPPRRPKRVLPPSKKSTSQTNRKANINVVSLNLGKLVDINNVQTQTMEAIHCQNCSAALSSISRIHHKHADIVWPCEFCQKHNVVTRSFRTVPNSQDVLYVPGPLDDDYINVDDSLVVFCVDISGSMCVTNENVQEAILTSLNHMTQTCPQKRVALVTFNDEVTIYGDGTQVPTRLSNYQLLDSDYLKEKGRDYPCPRCIAESLQTLSHRVNELREQGATALGPAALVAVSMASKSPRSKVIICTDGKANIGLGYLESVEEDMYECSKQFYTDLGEQATLNGVIVSVLTIEGTDCRLAELGKLADRTGGRVNIVNPINLPNEIQATLEDDVIATDVTVTFVVTEQMYFRYEEQKGNKLVKHVGNVTKDTELTFEFGIKESHIQTLQDNEKLPFQLQVNFTTRDRRKACRVISQEKHITNNSSLVEESVNITVLGIHAAQLSGRLTMEGRVKEACSEMAAQKELIQKIVEKKHNQEEDDIYQNWLRSVAVVCEDLTHSEEVGSVAKSKNDEEKSDSVFKMLSDEVASTVYRLKNARSRMLKKPVPKPTAAPLPMI